MTTSPPLPASPTASRSAPIAGRLRGALVVGALLLVPLLSRPSAAEETVRLPGGPWEWTLDTTDLGVLRADLEVRPGEGGSFTAASREKGLDAIVSGAKVVLARLVTGTGADGVLLRLDEGTVASGSLPAQVTGRWKAAAFGTYAFQGRWDGQELRGALVGKGGRPWAAVRAAPRKDGAPARRYDAVAQTLWTKTQELLHDPRPLASPPWTTFAQELRASAGAARDDFEFALAFFAARQGLRLSHFALLRNGASSQPEAAPPVTPDSLVVESAPGGLAVLRAKTFAGTAADVHAAFQKVQASGAKALVVDLRGNVGGNLSSMAVASHLFAEPQPAGVFVGNAWWRAHDQPPTPKDLESQPVFDRFDLDAFHGLLRERGLVVARVPVASPRFSGPVAVLVDRATASACEPLVALLKAQGRAKVLGAKTAGAMLSSEAFDVGDGWSLRLPTADYFTAAGERLEGRGVEPDVAVDPIEAEARAREVLVAQ